MSSSVRSDELYRYTLATNQCEMGDDFSTLNVVRLQNDFSLKDERRVNKIKGGKNEKNNL
jgi:hypothetical protein